MTLTALVLNYFALPALAIALALTGWRTLKGPSLGDRVVGLDLMTTLTIGLAGALALQTSQPALLDVGLVIALIAFLGTVGFAHFIGQRSAKAKQQRETSQAMSEAA